LVVLFGFWVFGGVGFGFWVWGVVWGVGLLVFLLGFWGVFGPRYFLT
jgi:hypothetical protein